MKKKPTTLKDLEEKLDHYIDRIITLNDSHIEHLKNHIEETEKKKKELQEEIKKQQNNIRFWFGFASGLIATMAIISIILFLAGLRW